MSYPVSHSYGGLGNYSGQYQTATTQPGLARYGQSLSSDNLDFSNLGQSYAPTYNNCGYQPAPYYSSNLCNQLDANDPRLLQQIDQIVSGLTECKRPILRRQVITVPSPCPGRVAYVTRRLPTPPPDIIERITVVKPPRDVVNLCIEKPTQPSPCYQERNICGKPRKPIIQPRIITVNPRCNPCAPCPQPCVPCPPPSCNPCGPCGPQSCNPCAPSSCGPCAPQSCNPCAPSSCGPAYTQPGQNYQAQVPLSPSPSGSNLSTALTQPPALSQPAYTQQGYSQQAYPSSQYQGQAYQQGVSQTALQQALQQQAAYQQQQQAASYQQAPQAYSQQAYAQQGYPQAAYTQQAQAYPQAQQAYTQQVAQQPQQGYYPQQGQYQ